MARTVAALIAGVIVGVIVGGIAVWLLAAAPKQDTPEVVRDIVAVPKMPASAGVELRDEQFESLQTIEQVLALPTRFMQAEALHVLAGRSDSAEIQNLIFDANRIADEQDREGALTILFYRLTELDPYSALALTRTEYFRGHRVVEHEVWKAFGRTDLDAAIAAASEQTSATRKNMAAQSLYAAFGYLGNEITDRIEAELGVAPDRSTRAQYLYRLADRSPAEAIAWINTLESQSLRRDAVSMLASYLAQPDPERAASFESLLADVQDRAMYKNVVARDQVRANPRTVLDQLIASGRSGLSRNAIHTAMRAIASNDLDAAIVYFDQLTSLDDRRSMGSVIASELAEHDIDQALTWARAHDRPDMPRMMMNVLRILAVTDPQRALSEAMATGNVQTRTMLIMNTVQGISWKNPQSALDLIEQIADGQEKNQVREQIMSQWVRTDPDAAVNWVLGLDDQAARELLENGGSGIIRNSPESAIRLLPLLDGNTALQWRHQIAQSLASSRSPEEAMNFISRFDGQEGFESLQSAIITGVAQTDPDRARMMADQLSDTRARDSAYSQIIRHKAMTDPASAAGMINAISTDSYQSSSAGNLARQWTERDAPAARRWVEGLPRGKVRDAAIASLVGTWETIGPSEQALINSIESQHTREQAKVNRLYTLARTNPDRARELLDDTDISESQRQRVLMMIEQYNMRRGR